MVDVGDAAPDFTVPLVTDEIRPFTLSEHLARAPIVLVFFPGAFTSTCTEELCSFDDLLDGFEEFGATVYGVSVDTPFSLSAYRDEEGLDVGLLSDHDKEVVHTYDVTLDYRDIGVFGLADRAVVVVDADRTVSYRWVADDPTGLPDYGAVEAAARDAA